MGAARSPRHVDARTEGEVDERSRRRRSPRRKWGRRRRRRVLKERLRRDVVQRNRRWRRCGRARARRAEIVACGTRHSSEAELSMERACRYHAEKGSARENGQQAEPSRRRGDGAAWQVCRRRAGTTQRAMFVPSYTLSTRCLTHRPLCCARAPPTHLPCSAVTSPTRRFRLLPILPCRPLFCRVPVRAFFLLIQRPSG